MSNFVESRVDTIKKALSPLGFDAKDYADGWDCVVLTLSGNREGEYQAPRNKESWIAGLFVGRCSSQNSLSSEKGHKKRKPLSEPNQEVNGN